MHHERCLMYESGELSPTETLEFEGHLEGCFECRERLETAKAAHRWAEAAADPPKRLTAVVLLGTGRAPAVGRARNASFALACLLLALSLARNLSPLLPGATAAREDLERLHGDARKLEEAAHE